MKQLWIKASAVLIILALLVAMEKWIPFEFLILKVQNLLNVTGGGFKIGNAQIFRQTNWMLSTSRETRNGKVTVFAFLPEFLIPTKIDGPSEPFKSFLVFNNVATQGQITFVETPLEVNCKLKLIEERIRKGGAVQDWQIATQNGANVILHRNPASSEPSSIYSTETRLTIILKSVDKDTISHIAFKFVGAGDNVICKESGQ